jgi:hypothetical protein
MTVTSKADLSSSLRALTEGKSTQEAVAALAEAKAQIQAIARNKQNSVLGGVDAMQALAAIDQELRHNPTITASLQQVLGMNALTAPLAVGMALPGVVQDTVIPWAKNIRF